MSLGEQEGGALEIETFSLVGETATSLLTVYGSEQEKRNNRVNISHACKQLDPEKSLDWTDIQRHVLRIFQEKKSINIR